MAPRLEHPRQQQWRRFREWARCGLLVVLVLSAVSILVASVEQRGFRQGINLSVAELQKESSPSSTSPLLTPAGNPPSAPAAPAAPSALQAAQNDLTEMQKVDMQRAIQQPPVSSSAVLLPQTAREPLQHLVEWITGVASFQEVEAVEKLRRWIERTRETSKISKVLEKAAVSDWVLCASEHEDCSCTSGHARFGEAERGVWIEARGLQHFHCSTGTFGGRDPLEGSTKQCQCFMGRQICPNGREVDWQRCPDDGLEPCRAGCSVGNLLPPVGWPAKPYKDLCSGGIPYEPLWACRGVREIGKGHRHGQPEGVLAAVTAGLCADPAWQPLLEVYLDCEFVENYRRWTTEESEWLEEAYVTYIAGRKGSKYELQATNLVRSVHLFSNRPIIVIVFDDQFVPPTSWRSLPCVLVFKMRPGGRGVSFNFNKIRAMISSRALVGIELDTDQIIFKGMDMLFNATRREVTEFYPWPIMPVHWMSRDDHPLNAYRVYAYTEYKGKPSMRWNHAHPTWSYWSLPFLANLLLERMVASVVRTDRYGGNFKEFNLDSVRETGVLGLLRSGGLAWRERDVHYQPWMFEDEDMLNVLLWMAGADKAWCKFDLEPELFTTGHDVESKLYADGLWYPDGVPLIFLSSHNTKQFEPTDWLMGLLDHCSAAQPELHCNAEEVRENGGLCKPGSRSEREARVIPSKYLNRMCCCVEPRHTHPAFWHGIWYTSTEEVPEVAAGGSGQKRRCLMP